MLGVSLHHLAEHHIGRSVVSLEDALPQVEGDTLGPDGDPWQVAHGAAPWPGLRGDMAGNGITSMEGESHTETCGTFRPR